MGSRLCCGASPYAKLLLSVNDDGYALQHAEQAGGLRHQRVHGQQRQGPEGHCTGPARMEPHLSLHSHPRAHCELTPPPWVLPNRLLVSLIMTSLRRVDIAP